MAVPFILADPDFETKELRRTVAPGESLRRLQVAFPARIVTHAPIQTFHFDREGLLRRLDYRAPHADHVPIAQVYSGHQRFSGILVPTLCRLVSLRGRRGALVPAGKPGLLGCRNLRRQLCHGDAFEVYATSNAPHQPASDGSKPGETLHCPEQSLLFALQHIASGKSFLNVTTSDHRGAPSVSKEIAIAARRSTLSRDATRFSALPCQHKPWCSQGRSQ